MVGWVGITSTPCVLHCYVTRERYRDLIGAADSISDMMSCSKQVRCTLKSGNFLATMKNLNTAVIGIIQCYVNL